MNQASERLLDEIFSDDSLFLAVIDADSPAELKRISLNYIKKSTSLDDIDPTNVQWKSIYREIQDINDPINI